MCDSASFFQFTLDAVHFAPVDILLICPVFFFHYILYTVCVCACACVRVCNMTSLIYVKIA